MDNSLDPVHFEWLHNYWGSYVLGMEKPPEEREAWKRQMQGDGARGRHEVKVGFDRFDYGVIKRRLMQGDTEENEWWRIGHPVLFPNILRVGQQRNHGFQMRVPMDDTHTYHIVLRVRVPEPGTVIEQTEIPYTYENVFKDNGRIRADWVLGQDQAAWIMQGPISDRTTEKLGVTDVGIILYRKILEEQMQIVEDGGEPDERPPRRQGCDHAPAGALLLPRLHRNRRPLPREAQPQTPRRGPSSPRKSTPTSRKAAAAERRQASAHRPLAGWWALRRLRAPRGDGERAADLPHLLLAQRAQVVAQTRAGGTVCTLSRFTAEGVP